MIKKLVFLSSTIAALFLSLPQAHAALQLVNGPGEYEDTDYESQVSDGNGNSRLDGGDLLLAIFAIDQQVNKYTGTINGALDGSVSSAFAFAYGRTTNMLTGVSMLKVKTVDVIGGTAIYAFEAPTKAEWLAKTGLVVAGDSTVVVAYDDPPANQHIRPNNSIAQGITSATHGVKLWEFGLVGAGTFWQADAIDTDAAFDPTNPVDVNVLSFFAALNLVSGGGLLSHNILGDPDLGGTNSGLFTKKTDLQLQGNLQPGSTGAFQLRTDSNIYLNVGQVPEPASMLVWAGLAGIGAIVRFRRKK